MSKTDTNESNQVAAHVLEKADLNMLARVHRYNGALPGAPFLIWGRGHKRARALVEAGLLKDGNVKVQPLQADAVTVFITQAGCDAYNAALSVAGV